MSLRGDKIRLRQKYRERQDERQLLLEKWYGLMGDGEGNLYPDPTDLTFVFVRRTGRARVERVRNVRVTVRNNLPVIVGFSPERPDEQQVLDTDDTALTTLGAYGYVKNHHQQHELHNDDGGDDTVWVFTQQFLYLLCQVTDPISLQLDIRSGVYLYRGDYRIFPGGTTVDLSTYAPGVGLAVMVLISIDAATSSIQDISSTAFIDTLAEDSWQGMVPDPPAGSIPVAAVFVPNGVTTIDWDYVLDQRVFVNVAGDVQAHSILSTTHIDTSPGNLVRGDLLTVGSGGTPLLQRLGHPGVINRILRTPDINDVSWSDWSLVGTAGQTYTFSATGGTVPTGTGTAPRVVIWGALNTLTDDAGLSTDAANDLFIVANAGGIANSAATARLHFDSSGGTDYAYFLGCNVGVGIAAPGNVHLYVYDATLTSAATFYGIRNHHIKTAGAGAAGDDYYGIGSHIELDQATTIDNMFGMSMVSKLTSGTADTVIGAFQVGQVTGGTVNVRASGLEGTANIDGGTLNDVYGLRVLVDIEPAATVNGTIYGAWIRVDDDDNTSTSYMLYLDEQSNVDFGVYQSGSAANIFGGSVRIGAAANHFITGVGGDSWWVGGGGLPFGSCWGNEIAWAQAAAVQNQWYEISDADMTDGQLHLVTHDGDGELTVSLEGRYLATWTIAAEADGANVHVQTTFYVDGAAMNEGMNHFETFAANRQGTAAGTAILDLTNTSTVAVAIRTTDAGNPDLEVDHLNITLVQIGGT